MNQITKTIDKQMWGLHPPVKEFVLSDKWQKDLEIVANQLGLNEEQKISFENEVFLVLTNMEETESLVDNIAKEVGVSEEVANQAVEKIDIAIFDPLRKIISSDNSKEASPSSKVEERLENIVSTPNTPAGSERDKRYPGGSDPYREPFE